MLSCPQHGRIAMLLKADTNDNQYSPAGEEKYDIYLVWGGKIV
jgi:hypothetical protein